MKTLLIIAAGIFGTASTYTPEFQKAWPVGEQGAYAFSPEALLVLNPKGEYDHPGAQGVRIVTFSETEIVLQCSRQAMEQRGDDYGPFGTYSWREYFKVENGKIVFVKIVHPKVSPAVPAKIDWPNQ